MSRFVKLACVAVCASVLSLACGTTPGSGTGGAAAKGGNGDPVKGGSTSAKGGNTSTQGGGTASQGGGLPGQGGGLPGQGGGLPGQGGGTSSGCDLNNAATPCPNMGDGCYVLPTNLDGMTGNYTATCEVAGKVAPGASCNPNATSVDEACAPGGFCAGASAASSKCLKLCKQGSDVGCAAMEECVPAAAEWTSDLGVCAPKLPSCSLTAQDCAAATDGCVPNGLNGDQLEGACIPFGTVAVDATCKAAPASDAERCVKGSFCYRSSNTATTGVCTQVCGLNNTAPTCSVAGNTCQQLTGIANVGLCGKPLQTCDLLTQNCPTATDACLPNTKMGTTLSGACTPAGTVAIMGTCTLGSSSAAQNCVKGSVCLPTQQGATTGLCIQMCGPNNTAPTCSTMGQTCQSLTSQGIDNVGICN